LRKKVKTSRGRDVIYLNHNLQVIENAGSKLNDVIFAIINSIQSVCRVGNFRAESGNCDPRGFDNGNCAPGKVDGNFRSRSGRFAGVPDKDPRGVDNDNCAKGKVDGEPGKGKGD